MNDSVAKRTCLTARSDSNASIARFSIMLKMFPVQCSHTRKIHQSFPDNLGRISSSSPLIGSSVYSSNNSTEHVLLGTPDDPVCGVTMLETNHWSLALRSIVDHAAEVKRMNDHKLWPRS